MPTRKKKPNWGTSEAKQLIAQDMMDGIVPVNTDIVDPQKLFFELYANEPEFEKWPWCKLYVSRFKSLQKTVGRLQDAAKIDADGLLHDRALHPVPTHASNGMILWEGSDAAHWLDVDMAANKHLEMKPELLFATRECYEPFGKKRFAQRIDQMKQKAKVFGATPGQAKGTVLPKGNRHRSRKNILDPFVNEEEETEYGGVAV